MQFLVVSDFIDRNTLMMEIKVFERINVLVFPLTAHTPKISKREKIRMNSVLLGWSWIYLYVNLSLCLSVYLWKYPLRGPENSNSS